MKDFFISYTSADRAWAEWIAWRLEEADYSVIIQAWDFRPGSNFIAEMDRATRKARHTIAVLSQKYFHSPFTQAEWSAAFLKENLLPVRVQDFDVEGLLGALVYIDLVGKAEAEAIDALRNGVSDRRVKPADPPIFPGASRVERISTEPPPFPGPLKTRGRLDQSLLQLILYVNTRSRDDRGRLPEDVGNIRDWFWLRSAHVRWLSIEPSGVEAKLDVADLVIIDWSSDYSPAAEEVCRRIRGFRPDLPILIIYSDWGGAQSRKKFIDADPKGARGALSVEVSLEMLSELQQVGEALKPIDFQPREPTLKLHPVDDDDLMIKEIIDWIKDRPQLQLIIQKFFPEAGHAHLQLINGGWSEARLFQVSVGERIYEIKFFEQRDLYLNELDHHEKAEKWLGRSAAALRLIPELDNQEEAFPEYGPSRYPVCYDSGAPRDHPRVTFKECYRNKSDTFVEDALDQLLAVLAMGQPDSHSREQPWGDANDNTFRRTVELKMNMLAALGDLTPYGRRMYVKRGLFQSVLEATRMFTARFLKDGADADPYERDWGPAWKDCFERLQKLVYNPLPNWLTARAFVAKGHIHGDPVSRNCLINRTKPRDLRLINCGGYRATGRLVSDLALIERDLKLVLMSTEAGAQGLLDLEAAQLSKWRRMESTAVSRGLHYTIHYAPASPKSVRRAYSLISKVRQRAREVSEQDDKGCHYFAALLYWTLEILRYPEVRPTKKLLALHSAAEILRMFDP